MFYSKKILRFILVLSGVALLWNCSSSSSDSSDDEEPCNLSAPTISSNSPVISGHNIELSTPYFSGMAEYYWSGPNGFHSTNQNPTVIASDVTAGTYSLVVVDGACTTPTATTTIVVSPAVAPCSPTNNTATLSTFPNITFNSVLKRIVFDDYYELAAGGSNGDLTIDFANANLPAAGVYEVCADCPSSFLSANQVCISIHPAGTITYLCRANAGDVYISYVGGHLSATFCNLTFRGGPDGDSFVASGKVTVSN